MAKTIIHDRRGRSYELHPAVMIERGRGGSRSFYAVTKLDLYNALERSSAKVISHSGSLQTTEFTLETWLYAHGKAVTRIGCRYFSAKDGQALVRWAYSKS